MIKKLFKPFAIGMSALMLLTTVQMPNVEAASGPKATSISSVSATKTSKKAYVKLRWRSTKSGQYYQIGNRSAKKSWKYWKTVGYSSYNRAKYTKAGAYKVVRSGNYYKVYRYVYTYKAVTGRGRVLSKTLSATYGKTYYMVVRSYQNGKYSAWSGAKKVTAPIRGVKYSVSDGRETCLIKVNNPNGVAVRVDVKYYFTINGRNTYARTKRLYCLPSGKSGYVEIDKDDDWPYGTKTKYSIKTYRSSYTDLSKYLKISYRRVGDEYIATVYNSGTRTMNYIDLAVLMYRNGRLVDVGDEDFRSLGAKRSFRFDADAEGQTIKTYINGAFS